MARRAPHRKAIPKPTRTRGAAPPRPRDPESPSEPAPSAPRGRTTFPVVGVGASAGGLEAFSQLLRALPTDTGMAFVLVQHLDPTHESQLPEVLSRTTEMPVVAVTDRLRVERDRVFVIPSNADMTIGGGIFG